MDDYALFVKRTLSFAAGAKKYFQECRENLSNEPLQNIPRLEDTAWEMFNALRSAAYIAECLYLGAKNVRENKLAPSTKPLPKGQAQAPKAAQSPVDPMKALLRAIAEGKITPEMIAAAKAKAEEQK